MQLNLRRLLCVLLVVFVATPVSAATFQMQRGLNLDLWTTWPSPEKWDQDAVLDNFPEWRRDTTDATLATIQQAGFDFVRLPIDPAIFLEGASENRIARLVAKTLEAVNILHKAGLKVIVDFHSIPSDSRKIDTNRVLQDPTVFTQYVDMVGRLARALSDTDPAITAFEPFNEPVIDCDPTLFPKWPEMLKRLHAAARKAAPRHTLVLSGGCWSSAYGLAKIDPTIITDDNVIWTFHSYEPYFLTHQGANWTGDVMTYVEGLPYPPELTGEQAFLDRLAVIRKTIENKAPRDRKDEFLTGMDEMAAGVSTNAKAKAQLEEPFDTAKAWSERYNIPPERVFLGEFGMIRREYKKEFRVPSAWRAAYMTDMVEAARTRGFPWAVWSWGGAFGITLEDKDRILDPELLRGLGLDTL